MHQIYMRDTIKRIMIWSLVVTFFMTSFQFISKAELVNIEGNNYFFQEKIPTGKTGQMMDVTFTFVADRDYEHAYAGIAYDDQINSVDSNKDNVSEVVAFPFELTSETTQRKSLGKLKEGQKKSVTLRARVRRDVADGYYGVQVYVTNSKDGGGTEIQEYINVWIQKATETSSSTESSQKSAVFVLGENQSTPYGKYPNVMNYTINLRNNGLATAYDVTAALVLDKDSKAFPFDINEVSYNRTFPKIEVNETVGLDYSFMIRKDVYSGFYPIKMKITYREKEDGELKTFESEYYVNIKNKEEEAATTAPELADKDRAKARIIVDSFQTIPEKIIAGQEFELIIHMKNASSDLNASNILFSLESEKVSDSAVFSTLSGSNSFVVNALGPGESKELRLHMVSKASVDQRSYFIKINEKFDSPQFKNAEESVNIDLNVFQIAKLTLGNIALEPEPLNLGDEASLTFPISNSGRVTLYNVSVSVKAPFVKENEFYVGNIKPGETGNVDTLISAIEANTNMEKATIVVSYEDENGNVSTFEKEIDFMVVELLETEDIGMGIDEMDEMPVEEKNPLKTYGPMVAAAVLLAGIGTAAFVIRKKKKDKNI